MTTTNGSSSAVTGSVRRIALAVGQGASILCLAATSVAAQPIADGSEVRQIVTFRFSPGRFDDALRLYQDELRPIYEGITDLRRFRGYREVESPEALDLIVVSTYQGMAGMDRANLDLRRPGPSGQTALALYGTLSGMTEAHHDQFFEVIPALSDTATSGGLTVFEYLRLAPGGAEEFERSVAAKVRPFERRERLTTWSTTGRMLVSDGWDYVRIHGVASLADWQRRLLELRAAGFQAEFGRLIAARKTIIVREVPAVAVR